MTLRIVGGVAIHPCQRLQLADFLVILASVRTYELFELRPAPARVKAAAVEAALAIGVPVAVGAALGHTAFGLVGCLGAFSALYGARLAAGPRARLVVLVAAGLTLSAFLGKLAAGNAWLSVSMIAAVAAVAVFVCLATGTGPPGGYMFTLVTAATTHIPPGHIGRDTALVAAGAAAAALIAICGSRLAPVRASTSTPASIPTSNPTPTSASASTSPETGTSTETVPPESASSAPPKPDRWTDRLKLLITASFNHSSPVGPAAARAALAAFLAGAAAYLLDLPHYSWAAAAAVAVAGPGLHVAATLSRGLHRAVGTVIGIFLAAAVVSLHPSGAALVAVLMALQVVVGLLVARNYALGVCFITPLALLIADSASATTDQVSLLGTRLAATLVGCAIGIGVTLLAGDSASQT